LTTSISSRFWLSAQLLRGLVVSLSWAMGSIFVSDPHLLPQVDTSELTKDRQAHARVTSMFALLLCFKYVLIVHVSCPQRAEVIQAAKPTYIHEESTCSCCCPSLMSSSTVSVTELTLVYHCLKPDFLHAEREPWMAHRATSAW
jgi:hypothetical protein